MNTANGIPSTNALGVGAKTVFGSGGCFMSAMALIWKTGWLADHLCAQILAGQGRKKNGELALGRSRGGFSTKIHMTVDSLGCPLRFTLTAGQRHDISQA